MNNVNEFNWDDLAARLCAEFGESLVEEELGEDDAYNWWLMDATVDDIVDFMKKYFKGYEIKKVSENN